MRSTEKMKRYALFLLNKNGYSTNWMNAGFKELGATMRERSGKVEDWLDDFQTCKRVLDDLVARNNNEPVRKAVFDARTRGGVQ